MRGCSGISNCTSIPEPAHPLTPFSDVASERSKITAILSDHDIPHGLSRTVNGSVFITCQSLEDNFKDTLKKLRIKSLSRIIISQININSIRNKRELLSEAVLGHIVILMVSETKIDMSFPTSQFVIQSFAAPFRLNTTNTGGGILVYFRDNIPSKLLNISYVSFDTECLPIEINLCKTKWLRICLYNPHKNNILNHLMNLSKIIDRNSSCYDKYLCIGDFNSEASETALRNFCDLYKLKNLVREPTCFKNPDNPSCIDLFLTNCSRSFQDTQVIETGISDFHKMNLTVLKLLFTKQKHETIFYRNYKKFDNLKFKEALNRELMKHHLNNIDYENVHEIVLSILNAHAPLKKKHLRANHASFVTREFQKAVMKRASLRNVYLKKRTEATKTTYNYQRNICVSLPRKSKRSYFKNLNVKLVRDNKKFWKNVAPLFSNKIKSKERITLTENENIISSDKKVAETFHEFFSNVKCLNISQNPYLISGTSQTDPVFHSIEKFPNTLV